MKTISTEPTENIDEKDRQNMLKTGKMTKTECNKINRTLNGLKAIVSEMDNFDNIQKYYDNPLDYDLPANYRIYPIF